MGKQKLHRKQRIPIWNCSHDVVKYFKTLKTNDLIYKNIREDRFRARGTFISFDGGISSFIFSNLGLKSCKAVLAPNFFPVPSGEPSLERDRRAYVGTFSFELIYIFLLNTKKK